MMKTKRIYLIYIITAFSLLLTFSFTSKTMKNNEKSKLVIGIVIDRMRYDYLIRFANRYGDGSFKQLLKGGFSLENAHYNYIPTYLLYNEK